DSAAAVVPPAVTVPAGATQVTFPISTGAVDHLTPVRISASAGASTQAATLQVVPVRLVGLSITPNPAREPTALTLTFTLSGPAPTEQETIQLSTDQPGLVILPPASGWNRGSAVSGTTGVIAGGVGV